MPPRTRRTFLAALAAAGAGCTSALSGDETTTDSGTPTDAATATDTPTRAPTDEPSTTERPTETRTTTRTDDERGVVTVAATPRVAEDADAIRRRLHEAGLSTDVTVELTPGRAYSGARRDRYDQRLAAGAADPDLLFVQATWLPAFVGRDHLADLSTRLPAAVRRRVERDAFDPLGTYASPPGHDGLYGVPLFVDVPTMQYRTDLAREAGYDPEGNDWATTAMSWQRFSQVTSDVRDATDTRFGFTTEFDAYLGTACCTFNESLASWGGAYFGTPAHNLGPVGERPVTVDADPVLDTLRMYRAFVHGPDDDHALDGYAQCAPTDVLEWTEERARRPMVEGTAVMHRNWPYALDLNTNAEDLPYDPADYGAMPMPYGVTEDDADVAGTGGSRTTMGAWFLSMNANSQRPAAATEVATTIATDEFRFGMLDRLGWLPPRPDCYADRRATENAANGQFVDTLAVAGENAVPQPGTAVWDQQAGTIATALTDVVAGEAAPKAAMRKLRKELQRTETAGG